jgi:quinoprotein glucose dehydrogenase
MSADADLGLVYVPTGNSTPDYYGVLRRPFDEKYSSSVVALDMATGVPRWSFQTVHHDLWDYDVGAQPVLADVPGPNGLVRALIQPTKTGELFVLDRATGRPVFQVEEHPVPTRGAVPEETLAPTQPFSVSLPSFRGARLTEGDMWGVTPLDQMWCRMVFRQSRYEGTYTPPGLTPAIAMPGYAGGMNWGSVALDKRRHVVVVNTSYMPSRTRLLPRAQADAMGIHAATESDPLTQHFGVRVPQEGTPYGAIKGFFLSPLQVPCTQAACWQINSAQSVDNAVRYGGQQRPLGHPVSPSSPRRRTASSGRSRPPAVESCGRRRSLLGARQRR